MGKRKTTHLNRIWDGGIHFLIMLLILAGCLSKEDSKNDKEVFVEDYSEFLKAEENKTLSNYLDSVKSRDNIHMHFLSIDNFEKLDTDSISEVYFKNLNLDDNGALILLSRGNATFKILVGKKIHNEVSDAELTEITYQMAPYFKNGNFYGGLMFGFTRIELQMKSQYQHGL